LTRGESVLRALLGVLFLVGAAAGCAGGPAALESPRQPAAAADIVSSSGGLADVLARSRAVRPYVEDAAYRLQVLVATPTADGSGLVREGFHADVTYFYPASAVKLCSAVAALEMISELRADGRTGIDVRAQVQFEGRSAVRPTVASLVERALVVSDNDANNVLFDLVGQDSLHERMWRLGLDSVRIRHRLGRGGADEARESPELQLQTSSGDGVVIPARTATVSLGRNDMDGVLVGDEYVSGRSVVAAPMSFEAKNRISLVDLQELLIAVVRPELRNAPAPRLGTEERAVLLDALAGLPSKRGASTKADVPHKPLRSGVARVVQGDDLVAYGKAGRAYGFMVDNAYFLDKQTGKSIFVAATVYANANGRVDDDVYDYASVAIPLLADIGERLARERLVDDEP
jgi:hypothetical protein